jgi:hypothetical protein
MAECLACAWRRRSPADLRKRAPNALYNNNNKKLGVANCAAKCAANFLLRSQAHPQLTVVELFPGSASKCKSGPDHSCTRVRAAPKRKSDASLQQVVDGSCRLQEPTRRRANATEGKGASELLPSARPTHALVLNRYPPPAWPGERPLLSTRMARVGCPFTTVVGPKLPVAEQRECSSKFMG